MNLRKIRKALGMTQKDLSILLDVTETTIHRWETNQFKPDKENKEKIKSVIFDKTKELIDNQEEKS